MTPTTPTTPDHPFHDGLVSYVERLTYDFNKRSAVLELPPMSCASMTGCIRLFERIDPDVEEIKTISGYGGSRYDGTYRKMGGEWLSFRTTKAGTEP